MRTPETARKRQAKPIELLSSSDEDEVQVLKPRARSAIRSRKKKARQEAEVVCLCSDDDDDERLDRQPLFRGSTSGRRRAGDIKQRGDRRAAVAVAAVARFPPVNDGPSVEEILSSDDDETLATGQAYKGASGRGKLKTTGASDAEIARLFQQQEDDQLKKQKAKQERQDASFAASLHLVEERAKLELAGRKQKELEHMKQGNAGRSVLLVERVIQLVDQTSNTDIEAVGKDDAVYLAEKMLECQEAFQRDGKPTHVSIGFHYTHSTNLQSIRTDGLLTVDDRMAASHKNTRNTAYFGNGIYTGTNPHAFTVFGDCGLIVAVLKGTEQHVGRQASPSLTRGVNAVVGNKGGIALFHDEVILKSSAQVLPLVKFAQANIHQPAFSDLIWSLQELIQHQVLDEHFNESIPTALTRIEARTSMQRQPMVAGVAALPSLFPGAVAGMPPLFGIPTTAAMATTGFPSLPATSFTGVQHLQNAPAPRGQQHAARQQQLAPISQTRATLQQQRSARQQQSAARQQQSATHQQKLARRSRRAARQQQAAAQSQQIVQRAPRLATTIEESIIYDAPQNMVGSSTISLLPVVSSGGNCSICICPLVGGDQVVRMPHCKHEFHEACIQSSLKHCVRCPDCRVPITNKLQGKSPAGTMTVTTASVGVSGFAGQGGIVIRYDLRGGVQKAFHQNPGVSYSGTSRVAFMPNNAQGQDLLKRLKYAFKHGLTFTIGTSLTTQQPNVIVWGSIHQKTSISGGPHGWPDPNYFANANGELDALGVPPASQI